MKLHRWLSHRWYSFSRKYGVHVFLVFIVVVVLGLVAFLMYIMNEPVWRQSG